MTTTIATPDRLSICRYMTRKQRSGVLERCTAEIVEEGAEIDLCERHLAAAMQLLVRKGISIPGSN